MNRFKNYVLSTMDEDFRAIGLLPQLTESDDPTKPRDVPSPDPSTLGGLDDSEGDKSAHQAGAKQPKPKMGPADDDAEKSGMDPEDDGGSAGAQKKAKGEAVTVKGSKEASLKGESASYTTHPKKMMKAKGKNAGEKAVTAKGLAPVKKIAGMSEGKFGKAASLIEEVQGLLYSAQIDEEIDELLKGFRLVAEDSALLADRFTEVSDQYKVESFIEAMEELSADAAEALDIIENELEGMEGGSDEAEAVRHSSDVQEEADLDEEDSDRDASKPYDVPSPAFKEQSEKMLNVMVGKLMDSLEVYDNILSEMGMGGMEMEGSDDGHEVHVHTKAKKVHIHHAQDADQDQDQDQGHDADQDQDDMGDDDADHDMSAHHGHDDDMGDEEDPDMDHDADMDSDDDSDMDHDSDHDQNSLMAKMKALKARREAMSGGRPFR